MDGQNLIGLALGRFELRALLGTGGMAMVYRAYQTDLKREVAIKVLSPELAKQPGFIDRFIREAQTAASLEHPHIVPTYDFGTHDGMPFIAMRLLTGGTLEQRISARLLRGEALASLAETSELLAHLAGALDYAHAKGVVHSDIKAGNIMFDQQGRPYVVDMGIARSLDHTTSLSQGAVGTALYMPPEQWRDEYLTGASDQYALAVTIYYMLTGRFPFEASRPEQLMHKHLHEIPTPLQTWRPELPTTIDAGLRRALAKEPGARFPTVTAFSRAFDWAVTNGPVKGARLSPPPLPPPMPAVGAASSIRLHQRKKEAVMPEESRSAIRPVWLLGGAAVGLLALCALIGVTATAALLWFSSSRTSGVTEETPVALQRQATNTPRAQTTSLPANTTAPLVTLPTLLPLPGTAGSVPTAISSPSQDTGLRPAPEEAVHTYFNLVSEQRYDLTWPMLTDVFKQKFNCCHPNYNYAGYVEWWDSVDRVDPGNVHVVSQSGDRAVVYAELNYSMNNGGRSAGDSTPYIELVYDTAAGSWRLDDKRANP